jgi:hypothetical protein
VPGSQRQGVLYGRDCRAGGPGCSVPRCGGTFPVFAARVACLVIVLAADSILSVTRSGAWMAEAGEREVE